MAKKKPLATNELESETKKAYKKMLDEYFPNHYTLMVVPNGFGRRGIPDFISCIDVVITPEMVGKTYGMFVGTEAKSPVGPARKLQLVHLAEIIAAGGFADIVAGVDQVDGIREKLEKVFCTKV